MIEVTASVRVSEAQGESFRGMVLTIAPFEMVSTKGGDVTKFAIGSGSGRVGVEWGEG
jgi:hypothetical protein